MTPTHFHLILNHLPFLGSIIAAGILAWGLFFNKSILIKTGFIVLILMSLVSIAVFLSGESAEEAIEGVAGVSEAAMEEHEEAATTGLWLILITGILALPAWFLEFKHYKFGRVFSWIVLIVAIASIAFLGYVNNLGGKINHPELTSSVSQAPSGATDMEAEEHEYEHDDD